MDRRSFLRSACAVALAPAALPFLRNQMVATMCGGKLGFVRGSLPEGSYVPQLGAGSGDAARPGSVNA